VSKFLGMMSPPIMAVGVPALLFAAYRCLRSPRVRTAADPAGRVATDQVQLAALAVSWFLGTWLPFVVLSLLDQRTSYIYYMVIVMPGLYVAATYAASQAWRLARWPAYVLVAIWAVAVLVAAVLMYPFVPTF
jgi:hypothetical protein